MKPAERAALIDRLARAITWDEMGTDAQNTKRARASRIVDELLTGYEQTQRIGWVFVTAEDESEPVQ